MTAVDDRPTRACDGCLERTWLLGRLAGHLDVRRAEIEELLGLPDDALVAALAGAARADVAAELAAFVPSGYRAACERSGLELVCRCDPGYPAGLGALTAPPAVLHVAGEMERFLRACREDAVAVIGARNASGYGAEVARSLGRGLAAAGLTVVSGMAVGIDSAAHEGALEVGGSTVAVLAGSADRPYPPAKRALHRRIVREGAAVSELGPGVGIRRWMFPARNRSIAALARLTVVVEAADRSGALLTARLAGELGRTVGAVPGLVSSPRAAGSNRLLAGGAVVIRDVQDVLDHLYGAGARVAGRGRRGAADGAQARLLEAIAEGLDTAGAVARAGLDPDAALVALAGLELDGWVRRGAGGRYTVIP